MTAQKKEPSETHREKPNSSFDGGELDCGNGLLLLLRKHLDRLDTGQLLEILSTDTSVEEDLPAWCRLTGNDLVSWTKAGKSRSYLVCKGHFASLEDNPVSQTETTDQSQPTANPKPTVNPEQGIAQVKPVRVFQVEPIQVEPIHSVQGKPVDTLPVTTSALAPEQAVALTSTAVALSSTAGAIPLLAVMGIGSLPRPDWLKQALHQYLEGRLSDADFQSAADDAVELALAGQIAADVDVVTDGEQRRDNYASFVGSHLHNCQLVPLNDLLPLVEEPEKLKRQFETLDVRSGEVRHPVVFGKLSRATPLALSEVLFLKSRTSTPIKVALPGPYLLTRIMWLECMTERAYGSREELAQDIVTILRQEIAELLANGVSLVQLDEPVLTEVVFGGSSSGTTFMCGTLSQRKDTAEELAFATDLINETTKGLPLDRLAVHVCRGNWSPDQTVALRGDYEPLLPVLTKLNIGTILLEFCTERAGSLSLIKSLPDHIRVGVGLVNPKDPQVEDFQSVLDRASQAIDLIGKERLILTPDCGFATFADNPVSSRNTAWAKLGLLKSVAMRLC